VLCPIGAVDTLLTGAPTPDLIAELPPNCGAGATLADPFLATSRFKFLRFSSEPRAIPMPAEPDLTVRNDARAAEVAPPLPTAIVFPVPSAGATSGWKFAGNVPAKRGTVSQLP
jgi:hypothetical protein